MFPTPAVVEPVAKTFGIGILAIVAGAAALTGAVVGFFGGRAVEPDEVTKARKDAAEAKKAAKESAKDAKKLKGPEANKAEAKAEDKKDAKKP